jgi:hypothetical protein
MTISTYWFSNVRNRINRSTEKPSNLYVESAEVFGWLMPNNSAAFDCDNLRRRWTSLIATETISLDTLILPEAALTDYGASAVAVLRPLFDMVRNACDIRHRQTSMRLETGRGDRLRPPSREPLLGFRDRLPRAVSRHSVETSPSRQRRSFIK